MTPVRTALACFGLTVSVLAWPADPVPRLGPDGGARIPTAGPDGGGSREVSDVVTLRVVVLSRRGTGGLPVALRDGDGRVVGVARTRSDGVLAVTAPRGERLFAQPCDTDVVVPLVAGAPLVVVVR